MEFVWLVMYVVVGLIVAFIAEIIGYEGGPPPMAAVFLWPFVVFWNFNQAFRAIAKAFKNQ